MQRFSYSRLAVKGAGQRAPLPLRADVHRDLVNAATATGIAPELLLAVSWVESQHDPLRIHPDGRCGLMGLTTGKASVFGRVDRMSSAESAIAAARYFVAALARFQGSYELAVAAYFWGVGKVAACPDGALWPSDVQRYVLRVWAAAGWPLPQPEVDVFQPVPR